MLHVKKSVSVVGIILELGALDLEGLGGINVVTVRASEIVNIGSGNGCSESKIVGINDLLPIVLGVSASFSLHRVGSYTAGILTVSKIMTVLVAGSVVLINVGLEYVGKKLAYLTGLADSASLVLTIVDLGSEAVTGNLLVSSPIVRKEQMELLCRAGDETSVLVATVDTGTGLGVVLKAALTLVDNELAVNVISNLCNSAINGSVAMLADSLLKTGSLTGSGSHNGPLTPGVSASVNHVLALSVLLPVEAVRRSGRSGKLLVYGDSLYGPHINGSVLPHIGAILNVYTLDTGAVECTLVDILDSTGDVNRLDLITAAECALCNSHRSDRSFEDLLVSLYGINAKNVVVDNEHTVHVLRLFGGGIGDDTGAVKRGTGNIFQVVGKRKRIYVGISVDSVLTKRTNVSGEGNGGDGVLCLIPGSVGGGGKIYHSGIAADSQSLLTGSRVGGESPGKHLAVDLHPIATVSGGGSVGHSINLRLDTGKSLDTLTSAQILTHVVDGKKAGAGSEGIGMYLGNAGRDNDLGNVRQAVEGKRADVLNTLLDNESVNEGKVSLAVYPKSAGRRNGLEVPDALGCTLGSIWIKRNVKRRVNGRSVTTLCLSIGVPDNSATVTEDLTSGTVILHIASDVCTNGEGIGSTESIELVSVKLADRGICEVHVCLSELTAKHGVCTLLKNVALSVNELAVLINERTNGNVVNENGRGLTEAAGKIVLESVAILGRLTGLGAGVPVGAGLAESLVLGVEIHRGEVNQSHVINTDIYVLAEKVSGGVGIVTVLTTAILCRNVVINLTALVKTVVSNLLSVTLMESTDTDALQSRRNENDLDGVRAVEGGIRDSGKTLVKEYLGKTGGTLEGVLADNLKVGGSVEHGHRSSSVEGGLSDADQGLGKRNILRLHKTCKRVHTDMGNALVNDDIGNLSSVGRAVPGNVNVVGVGKIVHCSDTGDGKGHLGFFLTLVIHVGLLDQIPGDGGSRHVGSVSVEGDVRGNGSVTEYVSIALGQLLVSIPLSIPIHEFVTVVGNGIDLCTMLGGKTGVGDGNRNRRHVGNLLLNTVVRYSGVAINELDLVDLLLYGRLVLIHTGVRIRIRLRHLAGSASEHAQ